MIRPVTRRPPRPESSPLLSTPLPLVITADEDLLDDLLRLAAAAGSDLDVAADPGSARSRWSAVPMVVVGEDQAGALAHIAPTRRRDVYLVVKNRDDAGLWQHAVAIGAEHVAVLPEDESWLADRLADAAEGDGTHGLVVGVVGGRGGAGASVLATALAVTATRQRDLSAMLVDLDPLGGGLDLVLGAEDTTGLRWPELADSRGRLSARALRSELPGRHGLTVLSWDRGNPVHLSPESAQVVLAAAGRACDLVVLDLPRALDAAAEEAATACSTILLVVPTEVRAVAAATRVAARLTTVAGHVQIVSRGPTSSGLGSSEVAAALGLPLAVHMDPERRLSDQLDRGQAPGLHARGPLALTAIRLLDDLLTAHQLVAG